MIETKKHVVVLTTFVVDASTPDAEVDNIMWDMQAQAEDAEGGDGEGIETAEVTCVNAFTKQAQALQLVLAAAEVALEGLTGDDCGYDDEVINAAWELLHDLRRDA